MAGEVSHLVSTPSWPEFRLCHFLAVGLEANPFTSSDLGLLIYETVSTPEGCGEE